MGNGLASKLTYYWIFVLGGLSVSYFLKFATDGMDFIVMMIALSLVYWGMEFIKFKNKQRRGTQPSKNMNNSKKSNKKR